MLFVVQGFDGTDSAGKRAAHYEAHKAFLAEHAQWGVDIIMSGPLTLDDGVTPIGSHFVIEAPDRATAEAFHRADPFFKANVWDTTRVTAFQKRRG
ncbi:MAG: YciI family protein [Pseudomonadota bacterium]|nr:YciI family protein [Pseudomonadota bacterium]